jgi:hypothetical protein
MSLAGEDREPVVVAQPTSEVEAAILRAALESAGIPAWVVGGLTSGFRAEAPGRARVLVRRSDEARARAVLAGGASPDHETLDGDE